MGIRYCSYRFYKIGAENITKQINEYILSNLKKDDNTYRTPVLGLSGGKDSTVVAKLLIDVLKPLNIKPVFVSMPFEKNEKNLDYIVENIIKDDGEIKTIPIKNIYDSFVNSTDTKLSKQAEINLKPRIRMSILYMISQSIGGRVVGTGNKSEMIMGYSTKFGDTAYDFNPIGDLYKEDVVELGRYLGLPDFIIDEPPSDGISGLTDEENMGVSYLDILNFGQYYCEGYDEYDKHIDYDIFKKIREQYDYTRHKYSTPNILKLNIFNK